MSETKRGPGRPPGSDRGLTREAMATATVWRVRPGADEAEILRIAEADLEARPERWAGVPGIRRAGRVAIARWLVEIAKEQGGR